MQWYGAVGIAAFAGILGGLVFYGMDFDYMMAKITPGQSESSYPELQKLVQQAQKIAEQAKDPTKDAQTLAELESLLDEYVGSKAHVSACQEILNTMSVYANKIQMNPSDFSSLEKLADATNNFYNVVYCPSVSDQLREP